MTAEQDRLGQHEAWTRWGPYLSERAWGTVREDYSAHGEAWDYFPHDHARSRAYRWNEDGLAGISDNEGRLCFALALWNEHDPILKERLFGVTGSEGNHGEDVKEVYHYLDSTPTHSYMKMLYKYPQAAYPYARLLDESRQRDRVKAEYELIDTGVFDDQRYFDVFVEYAKAASDDILIRITVHNRGAADAPIHLLPTLWFRNTWSWGDGDDRPRVSRLAGRPDPTILVEHPVLGAYHLSCEGADTLLFTENDSNNARLFGSSGGQFSKDAFHRYLIDGESDAVNTAEHGTKSAVHLVRVIPAEGSVAIRLRLTHQNESVPQETAVGVFADFDSIFDARQREADEFYAAIQPAALDADTAQVQRQAYAGMLWSKQFYYFDVDRWLQGDPGFPPPPDRQYGRNREWRHLNNAEVISMPDKWEYPWYAAWDLAFHCIPLARVDSQFAKDQLVMILREWYQHPNGQIPAYEWAFGDVNPPVIGWAAWRVYQIDKGQRGTGDRAFLERVFHKLMLNFTWWVNRKDAEGRNVFQGGFLGLDNIGVFDRSAALPTGGYIDQSDGTSWMAMFALNLTVIALELAQTNIVYEDIATKYFEHFLYIAGALIDLGGSGLSLWDEQDQFFYDVLRAPGMAPIHLRIRSLTGLIPLLAVEAIDPVMLNAVPGFKTRLEWFLANRPHLANLVSRWQVPGEGEQRLLALVRGSRLKRLLRRALDPAEFLSDYGIRSISRVHADQPYTLHAGGTTYVVRYEPAESQSGLFGGNSNWRGPIWFPINYLLIESLYKFHRYYGDDFKVECPTGSGQFMTLREIADFLSRRLIALFTRGADGRRPFNGYHALMQTDPHWRDHLLFHEYFHGDTGRGLGASHQTGWTGLVADLIHQQAHPDEDR
ncbi:MAG: glucosidase [Chloroflexota bacterium]|nr:glucosidase [Chloroflexota bacterium]